MNDQSAGTARATTGRQSINPEFQVHRLNKGGLAKAEEITAWFDELLENLKPYVPDSRELALVRTKLEEACFYARKGVAKQIANQE